MRPRQPRRLGCSVVASAMVVLQALLAQELRFGCAGGLARAVVRAPLSSTMTSGSYTPITLPHCAHRHTSSIEAFSDLLTTAATVERLRHARQGTRSSGREPQGPRCPAVAA